jgi:CRP-like cAMP-binding protein
MELNLTLERVIEFLLETPLFEDLDAAELGEVVRVMQIQRIRKDNAIFKEGDAGDAWYVLYDGEAEVEKRDPFSPKRRVATLGAHACFGEMAILDDSPRSASVIARTEVTLFRFPSVPFQDLIEESNLAAFKLVHAMARTLCARQRLLTQQLTDLMQDSETDALGLRTRVGPMLDASSISE